MLNSSSNHIFRMLYGNIIVLKYMLVLIYLTNNNNKLIMINILLTMIF